MARSVVVTGANSGIGMAIAIDLAGHGYDVIGTARSEDKAVALRDTALARGVVVRTVLCDVTDAEQVDRAFLEIDAMTGGGPWGVVNNAGIAQAGAVEDVDDEAARYQLEVNLLAPARIVRRVLPGMRARGSGAIVNMSSLAGRVSFPLLGWYAAGKHGLEALTDALRAEVAGFGIRVVLIEPGSFASGIWADGASRLPDRPESPYAAAYARSGELTARQLPDPVWVARAVRLSLASPVPLPRYLVGADAMAVTALDMLTPSFLSDYVKGVSAGVRPKPSFRRR